MWVRGREGRRGRRCRGGGTPRSVWLKFVPPAGFLLASQEFLRSIDRASGRPSRRGRATGGFVCFDCDFCHTVAVPPSLFGAYQDACFGGGLVVGARRLVVNRGGRSFFRPTPLCWATARFENLRPVILYSQDNWVWSWKMRRSHRTSTWLHSVGRRLLSCAGGFEGTQASFLVGG